MKILPIIDTTRVGGPGKGLISLVKHLREKCDIPAVITFQKYGSEKSNFVNALEKEGIKAVVINENKLLDIQAIKSLLKIIRDYQPDIIQTHGYKATSYVFVLRCMMLLGNRKWVTWIHGWTAEDFKVKIFYFVEKLCILASDKIVFVAQSLMDRTRSPRYKSVLIRNGIDKNYNQVDCNKIDQIKEILNPYNDKLKILVIGRLSPEKGQDFVPRIARVLLDNNIDNFVFIVVGEGPEEENLRNEIRKQSLDEHIRLFPYANEIRPYFMLSDMYLLPSRSEGLPNVVLESMYLRCPVVSFDVGGVGEIISHKCEGLIAKAEDVEDLARAVLYLINNPGEREKYIEAGYQRIVNSYLNDDRAEKVYGFYEGLLVKN